MVMVAESLLSATIHTWSLAMVTFTWAAEAAAVMARTASMIRMIALMGVTPPFFLSYFQLYVIVYNDFLF